MNARNLVIVGALAMLGWHLYNQWAADQWAREWLRR